MTNPDSPATPTKPSKRNAILLGIALLALLLLRGGFFPRAGAATLMMLMSVVMWLR
jgi:hypothetical protein